MARRNPYEADTGDPTGSDGSRIPNSSLARTPVGWNRNAPPPQTPDLNSLDQQQQAQQTVPAVPMLAESGTGVNPAWRDQRNQLSDVGVAKAAADAWGQISNPYNPNDKRTVGDYHGKALAGMGIKDWNWDVNNNLVLTHADDTQTMMTPAEIASVSQGHQANVQQRLNPAAYSEQVRLQRANELQQQSIANQGVEYDRKKAERAQDRQWQIEDRNATIAAQKATQMQIAKREHDISRVTALIRSPMADPDLVPLYQQHLDALNSAYDAQGVPTEVTPLNATIEKRNIVAKALGMAQKDLPETEPVAGNWLTRTRGRHYAIDTNGKMSPEPVLDTEIGANQPKWKKKAADLVRESPAVDTGAPAKPAETVAPQQPVAMDSTPITKSAEESRAPGTITTKGGKVFSTADPRVIDMGKTAGVPSAAVGPPVMTPDQVRKAPSGTVFKTTDGRTLRKP